jgi:hypothetical protein
MTDYDIIKQKVKQLKDEAHDIQNLMEEFFNTVKVIKRNYNYEWETPEGDLEVLHQKLILTYESWYNQSHMLIQTYYPKKEFEFRQLHDNIKENDERPSMKGHVFVTYGISDIIQLKLHLYSGESPQKLLQQLIGSFSKQLAIIIALPEVIHLCKTEPVSERTGQSSNKNGLGSFSNQTINITSTAQLIDNSVNIQSFPQISNFIEKAISETELKHDLLKEINELKTIDNPDDYMLKYQNFVAILANHVTAFLPVLNFLLTQVPK